MIDDQNRPYRQDYNNLKLKKMQYSSKPDVIALTHKPKHMYPLFNLFELELNRFSNLPQFSRLHSEIASFNQELKQWKNNTGDIKNLFTTYHLYQNLFSRMKYTSSLVLDRMEAKNAYVEIDRWFAEEKPKVRNKAPEKKEGQLKQNTQDKQTKEEINSLLVSQCNKRDLRAYEAMARTAHTEFFPPKERLLQYKRRDLIEGTQKTTQRRAFSMSNISKGMARYRGSFATTRTSFKSAAQSQTKEEPKSELKQVPAIAPFTIEEPKETEQVQIDSAQLADMALEKQVQQQEILQQNMVPVVNEEDLIDGEEQIYSEEEKKETLRYKKYNKDQNADDQMRAEENIKDIKQSTLRRILKQKQEAIKRKMQELNLAHQAQNWAGVKSRRTTDEHRKLQRMHLANKYKELQFIPKTFGQRQLARKRDIPQFQTLYRSKSSHPGSIEGDIEKMKINTALKTYGKYINHVNIVPIKADSEEEKEQIRVMRSTSLTSFCRQGKKAPFSSIVEQHGAQRQNQEATEYMVKIKDRLAKTAIPVEKRDILMGMYVTDTNMMDLPASNTIYPPKKDMLSNPFFPKHLYQAKKKKK